MEHQTVPKGWTIVGREVDNVRGHAVPYFLATPLCPSSCLITYVSAGADHPSTRPGGSVGARRRGQEGQVPAGNVVKCFVH